MTRAWDEGVTWFSRRTVEPTTLVLELDYLRDKVLRTANGSVEDDVLEGYSAPRPRRPSRTPGGPSKRRRGNSS